MSGRKSAMEKLFDEFAKKLADVLEKPEEVTASHLSVIRQFLKDNNITATEANDNLRRLKEKAADLPSFEDELDLPPDHMVQ